MVLRSLIFDPLLGVFLGFRSSGLHGPSLWPDPRRFGTLLDSLRDPGLGRDNFRRLLKTHLFTLYWSIWRVRDVLGLYVLQIDLLTFYLEDITRRSCFALAMRLWLCPILTCGVKLQRNALSLQRHMDLYFYNKSTIVKQYWLFGSVDGRARGKSGGSAFLLGGAFGCASGR